MCTPANIEPTIAASEKNGGYLDTIDIPISNFRLAGVVLNASTGNAQTSVEFAGVGIGLSVEFIAAATTTDIITASGTLPGWFREDTGGAFPFVGRINALQYDTTGSATLDVNIKLQATLTIVSPSGEVSYTGTVAATDVLGTANSGNIGDPVGTVRQEFDFGADMTAAEKAAIEPGSSFTIGLAPNESVDANVAIHIFGAFSLSFLRHARDHE